MSELENTVLDAVEIIAAEMVQKAGYDKTIQAQILSCEDPTIGKYKCRYQNSTFYAYSNNTNNTYSKGSLVYITIPNNDMSQDKMIKGTTNKLGINYISTAPEENYYDIIGQNCILSNETYYLNTNNKNYSCKIYQYQEGEENNYFINFIKQFENYIKQASALLIAVNIKTNIDPQKQYRGHYGIAYTLRFRDNNSSNEISRIYILDENGMVGNPYRMPHKTRQYKLFDIDGSNFIRIESIQIFNRDFPDAEDENTNDFLTSGDIEISDLEFFGAAKMTEDEINGVGISFYTPQGTFFTDSDDDITKTIIAQIKVKGRIATSLDNIPFYWGLNNVRVSANSEYYNKYLGRGWQCLNEKNIIQNGSENEPNLVEWVPGSDTYVIKYSQATARDNYLKVAVIYDNNIITKEINIRNLKNNMQTITIESDGGIEFYYDMGHPNLICKVNGEDKEDDYIYHWSYQSNTGVFEDLTNEDPQYARQQQYEKDSQISKALIKAVIEDKTALENATYNDIKNELKDQATLDQEINQLKNDIKKLKDEKDIIETDILETEKKLDNPEATEEENQQTKETFKKQLYQLTSKTNEIKEKEKELKEKEQKINWNVYQWQEYMASYNLIQRVYKNKIYDVQICKITSFGTFKCSVFKMTENNKEVYIGTAAITLYNKLEGEGTYSLVINNGTVVYQYDEMGNAPTTFQGSLSPQQIKTLSFTLYNNLGQAIESTDILKDPQCEVIWGVPLTNTLLKLKTYNSSSSQQENEYEENHYHYYKNLEFLMYDIASKYSINKTNNQITLTINYKGTPFTATTNFTFVKQGDPGTNGTDYIVKILPNTNMVNPPLIPVVTKSGSDFSLNYTLVNSSNINRLAPQGNGLKLLKAQLWNNGEKITDEFTTKWEMLSNPDKKTNEVVSSFSVTSDGVFKYSTTQPDQPFNIVKCTITYDNKQYFGTLPIITAQIEEKYKEDYRIGLKEDSGFNFVLYTTDGVNPQYNKKPFEFECFYKGMNIADVVDTPYDITYEYKNEKKQTIYNIKTLPSNSKLLTIQKKTESDTLAKNQYNFIPASRYSGYEANIAILWQCYQDKNYIGKVHIPIHFLLNKYGLANLNDWDGNSIKIDTKGGYILSPQMGAGSKNPNTNTFTGVLMGEVQQAGKTIKETGLFGYSDGARTFFLDSQSGGALFGKNNGGRIIIDPSTDKGLIFSNNYWSSSYYDKKGFPIKNKIITIVNEKEKIVSSDTKKGMLIDLSTPQIKFGSGHFSVNENGNITAQGGGTIANWNIGTDNLYSQTKTIDNQQVSLTLKSNGEIYSNTHNALNSTGKGFYLSGEGLSIGNRVKITNTGQAHFGQGAVSGSTNKHFIINSHNKKVYSFDSNGKINNSIINRDRSYIGYGITVTETNTEETPSKRNDYFIPAGTHYYNKTNTLVHPSIYIGTDGISLGSNFSVDTSGNLISKSGTIGGWKIGSSTLTGGTNSDGTAIITLNSNGSMKGPNWSISSTGAASFTNVTGLSGDLGTGNLLKGSGFTFGGGGSGGGSSISPSIGTIGGAFYGNGGLADSIINAGQAHYDTIYAKSASFDTLNTKFASIESVLRIDGRYFGQKGIIQDITGIRLKTNGSKITGAVLSFTRNVGLVANRSYGDSVEC